MNNEFRTIECIDKQIFMGSGIHTQAKVGYLYGRLSEAFDSLSTIQQPLNPCSGDSADYEEHAAYIESEEQKIEETAREIYVALTGKQLKKNCHKKNKEDNNVR